MSDREGWEERYRSRPHDAARPPSRFLTAHCADLPAGHALDVACGEGRHALYLARRGWRVTAIDHSRAALERLSAIARCEQLQIDALQADLTHSPLPRDRFDLVVNIRYLQRDLWPALKAAVRRGGMIVCETFLRDQQRVGHPKNPAFLLERGELAAQFADFIILAHEEGWCETESEAAFLARLVAVRP